MPAIRVNRLLPAVVGALALLFAVLDPPASRGLPLTASLGFWLLHIGVGMLLAVWATEWLGAVRALAAWHPWLRVLAGGIAGSLLFAPVALVLDLLLAPVAVAESADDLLDQWEAAGGPLALLAEWLQLSPSYIASWLLINAVPLVATSTATLNIDARPGEQRSAPNAGQPAVARSAESLSLGCCAPVPEPAAGIETPLQVDACPLPAIDDGTDAKRVAFLAQLPPAIGVELIAIQADLHYLQVRTVRGRATVLASIATAEAALAADGLRVHRSHWVALAHVVRVARTARGMFLTLSDGGRVPVSRRRAREVQARLGQGFVIDPR
jgi:hypothetical protein